MFSTNSKIIEKFPPAFKSHITPYKQQNYSWETLNALENHTSLFHNCCKVILIGDVSVGKTAIVNRFSHGTFAKNYKATIGVDFEVEYFRILDRLFTLQLWDTAGQEKFKCIAHAYYRNSNVIVAVFDMTEEKTLKTIPEWLNSALTTSSVTAPLIFLVGTKCDEIPTSIRTEIEQNAKIVAQYCLAEYWTVSAKTGYNIVELFQRIAALAFDNIVKHSACSEVEDKRIHSSALKLHQKAIKKDQRKQGACRATC